MITLIGVPLDLGAGRRGVDMGPSALRVADMHAKRRGARLRGRGPRRPRGQDPGDAGTRRPAPQVPEGDPRGLRAAARPRGRGLAARAPARRARRRPLGRDGHASPACRATSAEREQKIGLIWFDAHGDMNTPETSPAATSTACRSPWRSASARRALVEPGRRRADGGGRARGRRRACATSTRPSARTSKTSGIGAFTMRDIDERGMRAVMEEAIKRATTRHRRHPRQLRPRRRSTPTTRPAWARRRPAASRYREAHLAMEMLSDTGKVLSAEFVEVNPILDQRNGTAKLGVELLARCWGRRSCSSPGTSPRRASGLVPGDLAISLAAVCRRSLDISLDSVSVAVPRGCHRQHAVIDLGHVLAGGRIDRRLLSAGATTASPSRVRRVRSCSCWPTPSVGPPRRGPSRARSMSRQRDG